MTRRFVVGTEDGRFATENYDEEVEVYDDPAAAQLEADTRNEFGWMPGADGLVLANAWKVYELVEVLQ